MYFQGIIDERMQEVLFLEKSIIIGFAIMQQHYFQGCLKTFMKEVTLKMMTPNRCTNPDVGKEVKNEH